MGRMFKTPREKRAAAEANALGRAGWHAGRGCTWVGDSQFRDLVKEYDGLQATLMAEYKAGWLAADEAASKDPGED